MLTHLRLNNFKSFQQADLTLGPLTILVGTNAAGKSNLRDAFRFLHGIGRGYNLADIVGEKYGEGGVLQWRGIRGGIREIILQGQSRFSLDVSFLFMEGERSRLMDYQIQVTSNFSESPPSVYAESLNCKAFEEPIFETEFIAPGKVQLYTYHDFPFPMVSEGELVPSGSFYSSWQPILTQLSHIRYEKPSSSFAGAALNVLSDMRFLDLDPGAMRIPSYPGQIVLGDRGENLSSVLQHICQDDQQKQELLQWIQELTPMDAQDFEFPADFSGRILVHLVEENGQKISANSASDGTLRFLAMLAALLGPQPAKFYFFEELDNGIHPTRLHLLLQLIEQKVAEGKIQVVATTHSPQLLRFLSPESLEHTSLIYRLPNQPNARIQRILDIPEARQILETQDLARLHESGWLEDAVYFCISGWELETRDHC